MKRVMKSTYLRIMSVFVLIVTIPSLVIGLVFYQLFNEAMIETVGNVIVDRLGNSRNSVDSAVENAEQIIRNLSADTYWQLIKGDVDKTSYAIEKELLERITTYQMSNNTIDSIVVYQAGREVFITTYGYFRGDEFQDREMLRLALQDKQKAWMLSEIRTVQKYPGSMNQVNASRVFSVMFQEFNVYGNLETVLCVNLKERVVLDILRNDVGGYYANSYLLNAHGAVMSAGSDKPLPLGVKELSLAMEAGPKVSQQDGYLVISVPYRENWVFAYAAEIAHLSKYSLVVRNTLIVILGGMILLALTVTFWGSKSIGRPFRKVMEVAVKLDDGQDASANDIDRLLKILISTKENKEKLEKQFRLAKPLLYERFFHNLIAKKSQGIEGVRKSMEALDIRFNPNRNHVAVVKFHQYGEYAEKYDYKTQTLFLYAMENMFLELCEPDFHGYLFERTNNCVVCFLSPKTDAEPSRGRVEAVLERLRQEYGNFLSQELSIGLGEPALSLEGISQAYEQAEAAANYSILFGTGQLLCHESLEVKEHLEEDWERFNQRMISAIKSGHEDKVTGMMDELQTLLVGADLESIEKVVQGMILACISTAIELRVSLENSGMDALRIGERETLSQRISGIRELAVAIMDLNHQRLTRKTGDISQRTLRHLEAHYMNPLSLEDVARALNLSPNYLSKVFKDEMNLSFVDYLTQIRLGKACEMLHQKGTRVKDVYHRVGFSSQQYFNNVFKRVYGQTPGQYITHYVNGQVEEQDEA